MTDTITPALSAEEWKQLRAYTEANYSAFTGEWMLTAFLGMLTEHNLTGPQPHILMALANAALPDTDQRKITRADVTDLNTLSRGFEGDGFARAAGFTRDLAAKLAALLPPE